MRHLISGTLLAIAMAMPLAAQDVKRSIEPVTGDVHLMRNNFHNSLLVSTSQGVVRVDPINAAAGEWVNENLSQISDKPVIYLIWSHSHGDHGSGGDAHSDAITIAHEDAPEQIAGVMPKLRVGDQHMMNVGDHVIELHNIGGGHDNHMLVTIVRPENVAFIVDVAAPKRLPFRNFNGANIDDWIGQIEAAQALDFEIFAPGHGNVGTKADLDDAYQYMVDLKAAVLAGLRAGKSVEDLQEEVTMEAYSGWIQYDAWRALNIEGMASYLQASGQVN